MKLIPAILISIPFALFVGIFNIGWWVTGMNKDGTLLAILSLIIGVGVMVRVWNLYFETKKYGKQVNLDRFAKE